MSDGSLLSNLKVNKWTISVLTVGLLLNLGLTRAGTAHKLSWHEINQIRAWKEVVFSLIVGQSGKAVRKWKERQNGGQDEPPEETP